MAQRLAHFLRLEHLEYSHLRFHHEAVALESELLHRTKAIVNTSRVLNVGVKTPLSRILNTYLV